MTGARAGARPGWRIRGDWFDVCNCAIGCPCEFGETPTFGYCEGILAWHIADGRYGDVRLDGLSVVGIVRFEGSVLARNRELGFIVDERGEPAQREALQTIFSGEAGGQMAVWASLTVKPLGFRFAPIRFSFDPRQWEVEVPETLFGSGAPFDGLAVPSGKVCQIINPPRPEGGPGHVVTVGQSRRHEVNCFGYTWRWPFKSSKHMEFEYSGP